MASDLHARSLAAIKALHILRGTLTLFGVMVFSTAVPEEGFLGALRNPWLLLIAVCAWTCEWVLERVKRHALQALGIGQPPQPLTTKPPTRSR